jgi:hypothetical protein
VEEEVKGRGNLLLRARGQLFDTPLEHKRLEGISRTMGRRLRFLFSGYIGFPFRESQSLLLFIRWLGHPLYVTKDDQI